MAPEGIATLPMQGAMAPKQSVSSQDALDASKQALAQSMPGGLEEYERTIDELVAQIDLSPQEVQELLQVVDMLLNNEARYPELRAQLIQSGQADEEDLPPEFDRGYLTTILNVLLEKQARTGPTAMPAPQEFNKGGIANAAEYLRRQGRNGDTMLAHITPQEAQLLKRMGGSGTINPATGLPEFFLKKAFKAVTGAVKKIASSTVGRIVLTVALGAVLGPAGLGLTSSLAVAGGLAAGATTLAAGGSLKDALISGAIGGMSIGFAPDVAAFMPGTAGSFLNTALSAGAIGTAGSLLRGQSLSEALKSGAITGITAAGTNSLTNAMTPQEGAPVFDDGMRATTVDANGNVVPVDSSVAMPGNINASDPSGTAVTPVATPNAVTAANPGSTAGSLRSLDYQPPGYDLTAPPVSTGISSLPNAASPPTSPGFFSRMGDMLMPSDKTTGELINSDVFQTARNSGATYTEAMNAAKSALNPGMLAKYGPAVGLGVGALALTGGFKSEPATPPGLTNPNITGETLVGQDPRKYVVQGMPGVRYTPEGGIDYTGANAPYQPNPAFQQSQTFGSPQYGTSNQPSYPTYTPPMAAAAPVAGNPVIQPYNTMGMYNFLPSNQPRYMADGGIASFFAPGQSVMQMNRGGYPRKTGQISGPGTETSDDIPAMLSDGEFVITAKAVRGVGNGSRREGAKKLYRMMHAMEKKAGGKV
jgi:hypothetical protein